MDQYQQNSSARYFCKLHTTTTIDPHNFWAQVGPEENLNEFEKFEILIQEHCEKQPKNSKADIQNYSDQIVFVNSPKQKKWQRGEIDRITGDKLDIFYPDYGTTELVPYGCVCLNVPAEFKTETHNAWRCQLLGIQPIAKAWTSRAIKCFNNLAKGKTLDAMVISRGFDNTLQVALYTGEELNHRSVTHILLEEEVGLPWCAENLPEYLCMDAPGVNEDVAETPAAEVKEESAESHTDSLETASSASPTSQLNTDPAIRIRSFDTTAIETSKDITLEMLKISAMMESQKNNRSVIKKQLKDIEADRQNQLDILGVDLGVVENELPLTDDIVNEIHSEIREAASSADNDEGPQNYNGSATEKAPYKSRLEGDPGQTYPRRNSSPSVGRGRGRRKDRSASNSPVPGDVTGDKSRPPQTKDVNPLKDHPGNDSSKDHLPGRCEQRQIKCQSPSHSPAFEEKAPYKSRLKGNPGQTYPRRNSSPSVGRGRGRGKDRSASNSPVPGASQRSLEKVRQSDGVTELGSSHEKRDVKTDQSGRDTNKESTWRRGQMSPKEFYKRLSMILNKIESEGLQKHQGEFEDLLRSGRPTNHVRSVIEAVLEKAVRFYESFSSIALKLIVLCQGCENFGDSLGTVMHKLQSKYVRVHPKEVYYYESYTHILGELFLTSILWPDDDSLPLRLCVKDTLRKWIVFNKKKHQSHSEPLGDLFFKCFVELWGIVQSDLRSVMEAEWELIMEEIIEKIESDFTSKHVRHEMLNTLLSTVKSSDNRVKKPAVIDAECQTSLERRHFTTQTSVQSQHASCQANLITDASPVKSPAVLLTPEDLVKGDDLKSPDAFVVPKFTMPISPDELKADARLSPLSVIYNRPVSISTTTNQSEPRGEVGRGMGIRSRNAVNITKPFFQASLFSQELMTHKRGNSVANDDSKLHMSILPLQLMTPDVFMSSVNSSSVPHQTDRECEINASLFSTNTMSSINDSDMKSKEPYIPSYETNANNSNMTPSKPSEILTQNTQTGSKRSEPVSASLKKKKKQLLDLSTGKVIEGREPAEVPKRTSDHRKTSSPTFSYAGALAVNKLGGEGKSTSKPSLTMKSIAMDLLREPSDQKTPSPQTLSKSVEPIEPLPATAWSDVSPKIDWTVDNQEFPSLKEAEMLKKEKVVLKPVVVQEAKPDDDGNAESATHQKKNSEYALSEDNTSDSDENSGRSSQKYCAFKAEPKRSKPTWKPGVRKCLICRDLDHLTHNCPNKNEGFIIS